MDMDTAREYRRQRQAWYVERADWHGRMMTYSIVTALKKNTSEHDAEYYAREASALAREAWHFASLLDDDVLINALVMRDFQKQIGDGRQ